MIFLGHKSPCPEFGDDQLKKTEARLKTFQILENYVDTIQSNLKGIVKTQKDFERIAQVVTSANELAGNFVDKGLVKAIRVLGEQTLAMLYTARELHEYRKVQATAKAAHPHVKRVSEDLKAGLKVLDAGRNAAVKQWEECEASLVYWIKEEQKDYTTIELETRFRSFQTTRTAINALSGAAPGGEDPLDKVVEIHARIASGEAGSSEDVQASFESMLAFIKKFEEARKLADDNLREALRILEHR